MSPSRSAGLVVGVGDTVGVGVMVAVGVGEEVAVRVGASVGVAVAVPVSMGVGDGVGETSIVGVGPGTPPGPYEMTNLGRSSRFEFSALANHSELIDSMERKTTPWFGMLPSIQLCTSDVRSRSYHFCMLQLVKELSGSGQ
jgi:hypothetical protein